MGPRRLLQIYAITCPLIIGICYSFLIFQYALTSWEYFFLTVIAITAVVHFYLSFRLLRNYSSLTIKKANSEILDELERRSSALEASMDGMAILDANERYVFVNQAHAKIYGYDTSEDLVGKTWHMLYEESEVTRIKSEVMPLLQSTGHICIEAIGKKSDGATFPQEVSLTPMPDGGLICVVRDITIQKQLHDQLIQSQKMEAIGKLAGGIAHDFNNLLTGILGYTSMLRFVSHDPEVSHLTELLDKAAQKATQLTEKLLGFARKGKHQNVPVDLHNTIHETLSLLRRTIEQNISIFEELSEGSPSVLGDPVQIEQMILNLAINARDAMDPSAGGTHGGTLKVRTRLLSHEELPETPEGGATSDNYIEIAIEDSGCGIPLDIRNKIFEPFFTTKDPGKGTGMGLAMVYGIVRNHGGCIKVESAIAKGTIFSVFLPCLQRANEFKVIPQKVYKTVTGRGQILLVDDHEIIREVTSEMLSSLGYEVVTASDGQEALQYYKTHQSKIDLVIIDMIMPNMGARECFREFKRINPSVRAMLSTGYAKNNAVQEILDSGMVGFVQKPYEIQKLSEAVARALHY